MLETFFLQILNMSLTASIVIAVVMAARLLLKKTPKIFSYALWGVVLFRLVCPFSFERAVALPEASISPVNLVSTQTPAIVDPIPMVDGGIQAAAPTDANPMQTLVTIGAALWVCGVAALAIYSVVSLLRLKRKLRCAVCAGGHLYRAEGLASPFVMGLFRPKIYLPASLTENEACYIALHEQTHIRRLDHVAKLIGFAALCLHWFNPLVWAAFFLCGRDMELSCDEAVIKKLGDTVKRDYSSSLLTLATGKNIVGGSPLAFGEGDTKSRIKNVLHYKKPAFWVVIAAVLAVLALAVFLVGSPARKDEQTALESATQALLARDSSYTEVAQSQLHGDTVLLLASAPSLEVPDINLRYGVFAMEKLGTTYSLVASEECDPAMSLGFSAAFLHWRGMTVVFGDLGERYWNFRTDDVTQVEYTRVRVLYEGGEQSASVTNNAPYMVVMESDVRILDIEYYAGDTLVTSYAANYDGSSTSILKRELTPDEIAQVNQAFTTFLPADADGNAALNPTSHFFTSYYDKPAMMDMGKFVYYIPRESYLTAQDNEELAKLKETYDWLPFDRMEDAHIPFGRIAFATVDGYLQTYMNITLADIQNMGDALYSEEYKAFYSYASDFGPGVFTCVSGETNDALVTLYSDHAVLTLRKVDGMYFFFSHMPIA